MYRTTKSYYKILEVDSEASQEVIEVAYRRLARRYHPDLNPNVDSKAKMQELNEAYEVLQDAQKRSSYDQHLAVQTKAEQGQAATSDGRGASSQTHKNDAQTARSSPEPHSSQPNPYSGATMAMPTACQQCGRSDSSLRFATFPYVFSIILATFRQGDGGLFCSKCRRQKMNAAKVISFIFGWWGIPWGIFYTLGALFVPSEGVLDAKLNADYLRWLAGYFIHIGKLPEAKLAIQSSLELQYDPELAAVAHSIFGDTLMPQNVRSKKNTNKTLVLVILVSLMVLIIGVAIIDTLKVPINKAPVVVIPSTTQESPSPTKVPLREEWSHLKSTQSVFEVEHPTDWVIDVDTDQTIEINGPSTGFALMWSTDETEEFIGNIIANSETDPNFEKDYIESIQRYLTDALGRDGGSVERIDRPVIKQIGPYSVVYNDVTMSHTSVSDSTTRSHLLLYFFDCGSYVCQVNFYKAGGEPFTVAHFQTSERILSSIKFTLPASAPASIPLPSLASDLSDSFSNLSFCYENEFSAFTKQCERHHAMFTGIVERLYVSWIPSKEFEGASFLKKWCFNGEQFLDSESTNEYGFLEIATRSSLKPGKYAMELYVADQLVGRGSFIIQ